MSETTLVVTLTCGCSFEVYGEDEAALRAGYAVGYWFSCPRSHSAPVSYDPDTGEPRKYERNQQAVSVEVGALVADAPSSAESSPPPAATLPLLLAALSGKTITSAHVTMDHSDDTDSDVISDLQLQFSDGTHLVVRGDAWGWEVDGYGLEVSDTLD